MGELFIGEIGGREDRRLIPDRHPYGEINCVVQIDKTAELAGMQGWQYVLFLS